MGCSGFPVAKGRYRQHLNLVELQQTFYHPPALATAKRWREEAPSEFEFTMKAWQLITHEPSSPTYRRLRFAVPDGSKKKYGFFKPTEEVHQAWLTTQEIARALKARIILLQCPASFKPTVENKENLRRFIRSVGGSEFLFAWEPRGEWQRAEVEELCWELNLIYSLDPFKGAPLGGEVQYFRLHGMTGYRYRYTWDDLLRLRGLCLEGAADYVLFNNVHMYEDSLRFKDLISRPAEENI